MSSLWTGLVAAGAGVVVVGTSGGALACGAQPTPEVRFAASQPEASSQTLARDAVIVLRLDCTLGGGWTEETRTSLCRSAALSGTFEARVSVAALASGQAVAGQVTANGDAIVFAPASPLESATEYRVEASFTAKAGLPQEQTVRTTFRTSDALQAPFVSDAASLGAEWYDAPVTQCEQGKLVGRAALQALAQSGCPEGRLYTSCRAAGSERALRLHGRLGPLHGGEEARPYFSGLAMWRGTPADQGDEIAAVAAVLAGDFVSSRSGEAVDLYADLTPPADPRTPLCASTRVADEARREIRGPVRCATYGNWEAEATGRPAGDAGIHAPSVATDGSVTIGSLDASSIVASTSRRDAQACSALPGGRPLFGFGIGWLALAAGGLVYRRARR